MANTILIVDQNPHYREILETLLKRRGHKVTALEDGYLIGNELSSKTFDIFFLDTQTGGIRNKGLMARIKKACPYSHIILISSKRGDDFIKEAMDAGAYGCIDKPFNPEEVLTMVNHIIPNQKSSSIESKERRDSEKKDYQD